MSGRTHVFVERAWPAGREYVAGVDWRDDEGRHLFDIIDSVIASGADSVLALTNSMHDLVVGASTSW